MRTANYSKKNEPNYEQEAHIKSESQKKDTIYETPEDSIKTVKESVLRKKNYKKKKQTLTNGEIVKTRKNRNNSQ